MNLKININKLGKVGRWLSEPLGRRKPCPKQAEINRLRGVLHAIVHSRPDEHMDIDKTPELTRWICDACHDASVGAYPEESSI
jgi:hypothetical protein